MHDPDVVAFEIRRPWPRRITWTGSWYFPAVITVWHREPRGHDSGEICKHYTRYRDRDGTWRTKIRHGWRWHAWHWRVQVHSLQELRRRLLTRCAWCGGRHSKRDPVNHSLQWDRESGPWWRGERGLYHGDCASISQAHAACVCDDPITDQVGHGRCAICGKSRSYGVSAQTLAKQRQLATIPANERDGQPVITCGVCGQEFNPDDPPPTYSLQTDTGDWLRPVLDKPIHMDPETGAVCWCPRAARFRPTETGGGS